VSRTDKDRPYLVQISDPLNQRFRMVTSQKRWSGGFWKKMAPASQCWCCSHRAWLRYKRKRRSGWKKEV
jgi:hypothetical protein